MYNFYIFSFILKREVENKDIDEEIIDMKRDWQMRKEDYVQKFAIFHFIKRFIFYLGKRYIRKEKRQ